MTTPVSQEGTCARLLLLVFLCHSRTPHPGGRHRVSSLCHRFAPARLTVPQFSIRNRLTALKKDRGDFIKSSDVNSLYQAVIKQGP
jgi:hypothetical protein